MGETKRIYVPVLNNGEPAFYKNIDDHSVTLVYKSDMVPHLVPYEPAVPRCKTCKHFLSYVDTAGGTYGECSASRALYKCKSDGSGYCNWHSELNK